MTHGLFCYYCTRARVQTSGSSCPVKVHLALKLKLASLFDLRRDDPS